MASAKNNLYLDDIFVWHPGMITRIDIMIKKLEKRGHSVEYSVLKKKAIENGCLALISKDGVNKEFIVNYDARFSSGPYVYNILELDLSFQKYEENLIKHQQLMDEIVKKKKQQLEESKGWFWSSLGY